MHPKRQHYVSQFLLEAFGTPRRNAFQLEVLDLKEERRFKSTAYKVAKEFKFYDVERSGEVFSLEPWLGRIEAPAAKGLRRLRDHKSVQRLTPQERRAIARFVATLAVRGPQQRREIRQMGRAILEFLQRSGPTGPELEAQLHRDDRNDSVAVHNQVTVHISRLAPEIAEMAWYLVEPPPGRELCSSRKLPRQGHTA